jgi:hypothetical protein
MNEHVQPTVILPRERAGRRRRKIYAKLKKRERQAEDDGERNAESEGRQRREAKHSDIQLRCKGKATIQPPILAPESPHWYARRLVVIPKQAILCRL